MGGLPAGGGALLFAGGGDTAGNTPDPLAPGGGGNPGVLGIGNLPEGDDGNGPRAEGGMGGAMPSKVRARPGGGGGPEGLATLGALGDVEGVGTGRA
jgi:hypothetical protein